MQVVQVKNSDDTKCNALVVPKNEWNRLNKILTKNDDDRAAVEKTKRVKEERSALSKMMAETWGNSMLLVRGKHIIIIIIIYVHESSPQ